VIGLVTKISSAYTTIGDSRTARTARYVLFVRFIGLLPNKRNFFSSNAISAPDMEVIDSNRLRV
jgi:hypothetical protein